MHLNFSNMTQVYLKSEFLLPLCWKTEIPMHVFFLHFLTILGNSSSYLWYPSRLFLLLPFVAHNSPPFVLVLVKKKVSCKSYLKPSWTFWLRPSTELAAEAVIFSASYSFFQNKFSVILPTKHTSYNHSLSNTLIPWCTVSTSLDMHHIILTTALSSMEYQ